MACYAANPELRTLTSFINDLEQHAQNTDRFFERDLLQIINKNFSFENMAITIYDNFNFVGCETLNMKCRNLANIYMKGFYKSDCLAQFITNNIDTFITGTNYDVVRSSDALSIDSKHELYTSFLNKAALQYAAVLPVNEAFRLVIYKNVGQDDFCDEDMVLLSCLLRIVRTKYQSFSASKALKNSSKMCDTLLNDLKVGYITLNEKMNVLGYNDYAVHCLADILDTRHLTSATPKLIELFSNHSVLVCKNYRLTLAIYPEIDCFGSLKRYYYITLKKLNDSADDPLTNLPAPQLPFDRLTARELEVLDPFAKGSNLCEIAGNLFISEGTVKTHLKNIYRKLEIDNQRRLIYEYSTCMAFRSLNNQKKQITDFP